MVVMAFASLLTFQPKVECDRPVLVVDAVLVIGNMEDYAVFAS